MADETETDHNNHGEEELVTVDIETLRSEAQDYKDKYLRTLAEAENSRKRLQKERHDTVQYALQTLISDFLHPIDQLESALKHSGNASDEVQQWSLGFQMILTHFKDVLSNHNVHPFDSVGKAFDPHRHDAVEMVVTDEYPVGIVVEESVRGYFIGDKVLRHACVKVAKAPDEDDDEEEETT